MSETWQKFVFEKVCTVNSAAMDISCSTISSFTAVFLSSPSSPLRVLKQYCQCQCLLFICKTLISYWSGCSNILLRPKWIKFDIVQSDMGRHQLSVWHEQGFYFTFTIFEVTSWAHFRALTTLKNIFFFCFILLHLYLSSMWIPCFYL